jgi:hypothetical protein
MRYNPLNIDWKFLVIDEISQDPEHDVLDLEDQFEIAKQDIENNMKTGPIRKQIEIERVKAQILGLQTDLAELAVHRSQKDHVIR